MDGWTFGQEDERRLCEGALKADGVVWQMEDWQMVTHTYTSRRISRRMAYPQFMEPELLKKNILRQKQIF